MVGQCVSVSFFSLSGYGSRGQLSKDLRLPLDKKMMDLARKSLVLSGKHCLAGWDCGSLVVVELFCTPAGHRGFILSKEGRERKSECKREQGSIVRQDRACDPVPNMTV